MKGHARTNSFRQRTPRNIFDLGDLLAESESKNEKTDVDREYDITVAEFKKLHSQVILKDKDKEDIDELSSKDITAFTEWLAKRWERIRGTDLVYPHAPTLRANKLCIVVAKHICQQQSPSLTNGEKVFLFYSLLMPTVYLHGLSGIDFYSLALHEFILTDNDQDFIPLQKVLDDLGEGKVKSLFAYDQTAKDGMRGLSESEQKRFIEHSDETNTYYQAASLSVLDKNESTNEKNKYRDVMKREGGVEVFASYGEAGRQKLKKAVKREKIKSLVPGGDEGLFNYLDAKKSQQERREDFDDAITVLLAFMNKPRGSEDMNPGIKVLYLELRNAGIHASYDELPLLTELVCRTAWKIEKPGELYQPQNNERSLEIAKRLKNSTCCRKAAGAFLIFLGVDFLASSLVFGSDAFGWLGTKLTTLGAGWCGLLSGVSLLCSGGTGIRGVYQWVRSKHYGVGTAACAFFPSQQQAKLPAPSVLSRGSFSKKKTRKRGSGKHSGYDPLLVIDGGLESGSGKRSSLSGISSDSAAETASYPPYEAPRSSRT